MKSNAIVEMRAVVINNGLSELFEVRVGHGSYSRIEVEICKRAVEERADGA